MGWSDIMNILSKAPEAGALRVHLEAAWKKEEELNERIGKLADENTTLQQENRALREHLASLVKEKEELKTKTQLVDIGPCSIKKDSTGSVLVGFYCNLCTAPLTRANFSRHGDAFLCEKCGVFSGGPDVDRAFLAHTENCGN